MAKMQVAQVPQAGADFEIVEREIPQPGPGEVRIRVQACGVCHSDVFTKEGGWPGIVYPRVPGHEVAGVIDEVGAGVTQHRQTASASLRTAPAGKTPVARKRHSAMSTWRLRISLRVRASPVHPA